MTVLLPAILFVLRPLACFAVFGATSYALGRTLRRRLGVGEREEGPGPAHHLGLDLALGVALLAQVLWLLALAGWLNRWTVLGLVLAVHGVALLPRGGWRDFLPGLQTFLKERRRQLASMAALLLFAPLFVLCLYPPTGFDETLYHLPYAKAFADSGRLEILWDSRVPLFPQMAELLFAALYLVCGEAGPHLVSLLAALATALLIVEWGRRRFSPLAGWLGAAVFLGNPITVHLGTSGYIDVILTLFVAAGWVLVEEGLAAKAEARLAPFVLAGLCLGTAAGTKYLGPFFAAALVVEVFLRAPAGRKVPLALAVALSAAVAMAPTHLRLWLVTGNPLFPFLPAVFGHTPWDPLPVQSSALARPRVLRWLLLPWDALFNRRLAGWQPPFAPWLLLGLPLLLRGVWRDARLRALCAVPLVWSFFVLLLPSDVRYLMPAVPFVALALGVALAEMLSAKAGRVQGSPGRLLRLALVLGLVLAAPGWAYLGYRFWRQGPVPLSPEGREAYLAHKIPFYEAVAGLNRRHGDGYVLYNLAGENLRYFVRGRLLGDWTNRTRYGDVIPLLGDPVALDRKLEGWGATHLLVPRRLGPGPAEGVGPSYFRPIYAGRDCTVYERLRRRVGAEGSNALRQPSATPKSAR